MESGNVGYVSNAGTREADAGGLLYAGYIVTFRTYIMSYRMRTQLKNKQSKMLGTTYKMNKG